MIVESIAGPSPFTLDPQRHRIVENTTAMPLNLRNTYLLPEKTTALVLVDSFFVNVGTACSAVGIYFLTIYRQVDWLKSLTAKPS